MTLRPIAPLLLACLLAACGSDDTTTAAATAAASTDAAAQDADAVADAPAVAGEVAPTNSASPSAPDPAAVAAATAVASAAAQGPAPVAGTDYIEIQGGQPYAPLNGQVEVVEVFAYWCGACAQFDPLVSAWKARQPADVRFTYVPAVFADTDNFPRAFYAAETAGVLERTHSAVFSAVHLQRSLRPNASIDDIAAFYGKLGVDQAQMKSTMQSFAINAKLSRAKQFAIRSGIEATPTLVVNGKYRVRGQSHDDGLRIVEQLVARERAAASTPAATTAPAASGTAGAR